jgi:hypothetical protein
MGLHESPAIPRSINCEGASKLKNIIVQIMNSNDRDREKKILNCSYRTDA